MKIKIVNFSDIVGKCMSAHRFTGCCDLLMDGRPNRCAVRCKLPEGCEARVKYQEVLLKNLKENDNSTKKTAS